MNLFRRKAPVELSVSLADEALSVVGFHDAMKATSLSDLRGFRARLAANIEAETEALASIDRTLALEDAIAELQMVEALQSAGAEIEAAMDESDLRTHDAVADEIERNLQDRDPDYDAADDARKSYDVAVEAKRKRGDKHWPKRASEKAVQAVAAE